MKPYEFNLLYTLKPWMTVMLWSYMHVAPLARDIASAFSLLVLWRHHNKSISYTHDDGTHVVGLSCSQLGVPTWVAVLSFPTDLESVFNPITSRECEIVYVSKCDCRAFVLLMLFIHFHFFDTSFLSPCAHFYKCCCSVGSLYLWSFLYVIIVLLSIWAAAKTVHHFYDLVSCVCNNRNY